MSPCLFNFYAEYAGLEETQTGIKIARRNINNLIEADNTTLMAESEKELKNLLMKVKEESEKVGLKHNIHGCLRQVLRAGALGRPKGMGWGGRREEAKITTIL